MITTTTADSPAVLGNVGSVFHIVKRQMKLYRGPSFSGRPWTPFGGGETLTVKVAHLLVFDWTALFESGVCASASGSRGHFLWWGCPAQTSPVARSLKVNIGTKESTVWLENCSREEEMVLVCIAALAANLPRKLSDYADALTEINRNWFRKPVPKALDRNPAGRSLSQTHSTRLQWK